MSIIAQKQIKDLHSTSIRWTRITPSIFAFWIVALIDKFAVGIIVTTKPFLKDMAITNNFVLIGLLTTVVIFAQAIGNFLFGWVTDKIGPKLTGIIGSSIWTLSTAASALAPNLLILLIARSVLGLAEGYTWSVANSLTVRWFPLHERGRAKSWWLTATALGPGISGYIVGSLLSLTSWRGVFWCLAAISFLVCLPLIFLVKDDPSTDPRVSKSELSIITSTNDTKEQEAVIEHDKGSMLKTFDYWMAVVAAMGVSVGVWGLAAWFPSYLSSIKHQNMNSIKNYH